MEVMASGAVGPGTVVFGAGVRGISSSEPIVLAVRGVGVGVVGVSSERSIRSSVWDDGDIVDLSTWISGDRYRGR